MFKEKYSSHPSLFLMSHDERGVPLIETCMDWNTTLRTRCGPEKQQ